MAVYEFEFPELDEIFNPKFEEILECKDRYLILLGGRGSGKSRAVADMILIRMIQHRFFVGCAIRKNLDDVRMSCHAELVKAIKRAGFEDYFDYSDAATGVLQIRCKINGNMFLFAGQSDVDKIKSTSELSFAWFEEHPTETYEEFKTIDRSIRTVQADWCQIVFTINPRLSTDPTNHWFYQYFHYAEHTELDFRHVETGEIDGEKVVMAVRAIHCFVGETKVLTSNGYKRIDSIKVGELVMTRDGYKKVTHTHYSGYKEVKTYNVNNKLITCTPYHKFWTKEYCWREIDSLRHIKTTFLIYDNINNIWKEKQLFIEESNSLNTNRSNILSNHLMVKYGDCIDMSGCVKEEKYQRDITLTTLMETKKIIESKIYNVYQGQNTYLNINGVQALNQRNQNKKGSLISNQIKGEKMCQIDVKNKQIQLSEKVNVKPVVKNLIELNEVQVKNIAVEIVNQELTKENIIRRERVYDLTVEDCHEYIVEGILVHNSTYKDNKYLDPVMKFDLENEKDEYLYQTDTLGKWARREVGGRFYKEFNIINNVKHKDYDSNLPLFISFDFNTKPFLSLLIGQIYEKELYIIDEMPFKSPKNYTKPAVLGFIDKYKNHRTNIYVTGDATGYAADTSQEAGHNNYKIIFDELRKHYGNVLIQDRSKSSNPSVAMRGSFINTLFSEGFNNIKVWISPKCNILIDDLLNGLEKEDGTKLKQNYKDKESGETYEKWFHMADAMDYLIVNNFESDYKQFENPGKASFSLGPRKFDQDVW